MTSGRRQGADPQGPAVRLRLAASGIRGLTVLTDAVPARYRFGHWNRILDLLATREALPELRAHSRRKVSSEPSAPPVPPVARCLIVAGALDSGGIESVVATLALGLPIQGLATEVACSVEGRTADVLRRQGIRVTRVPADGMEDLVRTLQPDVIQLQRIDVQLLTALLPWASRTVPVFHAIESYLDAAAWSALATFTTLAPEAIAVSGSVARFFADRLPGTRLNVVTNGVPPVPADVLAGRGAARERLAAVLGVQLDARDVIVAGLQRFSDQKNAAGLVDAFLLAAESDPRLRLVVAGAPSNWLEVRRADILRRCHRAGDRVHLLGESDPLSLLLASDLYALDSFAEGGPITAIEAVSCGLPVVLSDVGFARELVGSPGVHGVVVPRANATTTQAALAAERRRRHQSNREQFASALVDAAASATRQAPSVPERFTEQAMVRGHAAVLHRVALGESAVPRE